MKTALGMGWGETERLVKKLTQDADDMDSSSSTPVVATKFTPSPWRTTVDSVVEACEESRKRLGVDSIDLYQIQMPDIVKPLRFLGVDKSYDEVYWDGLVECYHRGLVKNVFSHRQTQQCTANPRSLQRTWCEGASLLFICHGSTYREEKHTNSSPDSTKRMRSPALCPSPTVDKKANLNVKIKNDTRKETKHEFQ
mmetsp:Transcript_640/g.1035  ORF Transcript_640/g.1035 Transcript_640/m.1035 type:complete len:196 (-) Transcript_640:382-969(-)